MIFTMHCILDIYDALHTVGGIDHVLVRHEHHVLVRHEQAAVHMADGLARATGEVGVVLVTSGPGATNAITGIATAYRHCHRLYGFHSISCPFRAGSDLVDRL